MGNSTSSSSSTDTTATSRSSTIQRLCMETKKVCCKQKNCDLDSDWMGGVGGGETTSTEEQLYQWIYCLSELAEKIPDATEQLIKILEKEFPSLRFDRDTAQQILDNALECAEELRTYRRECIFAARCEESILLSSTNPIVHVTEDIDSERLEIRGPPPAASKLQIESLPTTEGRRKRKDNNHEQYDDPCHICCDHFTDDSVIKHLPCGHSFHATCIDAWLSRHCTCPVCRQELPTNDLLFEFLKMQRMQRTQMWNPTAHLFNNESNIKESSPSFMTKRDTVQRSKLPNRQEIVEKHNDGLSDWMLEYH